MVYFSTQCWNKGGVLVKAFVMLCIFFRYHLITDMTLGTRHVHMTGRPRMLTPLLHLILPLIFLKGSCLLCSCFFLFFVVFFVFFFFWTFNLNTVITTCHNKLEKNLHSLFSCFAHCGFYRKTILNIFMGS